MDAQRLNGGADGGIFETPSPAERLDGVIDLLSQASRSRDAIDLARVITDLRLVRSSMTGRSTTAAEDAEQAAQEVPDAWAEWPDVHQRVMRLFGWPSFRAGAALHEAVRQGLIERAERTEQGRWAMIRNARQDRSAR